MPLSVIIVTLRITRDCLRYRCFLILNWIFIWESMTWKFGWCIWPTTNDSVFYHSSALKYFDMCQYRPMKQSYNYQKQKNSKYLEASTIATKKGASSSPNAVKESWIHYFEALNIHYSPLFFRTTLTIIKLVKNVRITRTPQLTSCLSFRLIEQSRIIYEGLEIYINDKNMLFIENDTNARLFSSLLQYITK